MDATFEISGRKIGPREPPYVVAELSGNHGQDFGRAVRLVEAAAQAGAAAIKLQTYTPETMTLDLAQPPFQIEGTPWAGQTLFDLYRRAATPWDWQPRLMTIARDLGLHAFATPFDSTAVNFLESLGVPAYKIASFELVNLPLLTRVARTGKPIILSTGMATLDEIAEAVQAVRAAGGRQLALLKCTSAYPALPVAMNLRTLPHLAETFGVPVGLSDHSLSPCVPVAAVALGAAIVEKHLHALPVRAWLRRGLLVGAGRVPDDGRGRADGLRSVGPGRVRSGPGGTGRPAAATLAICGPPDPGGRALHAGESPHDPSGRRSAAASSGSDTRPPGVARLASRHAAGLGARGGRMKDEG